MQTTHAAMNPKPHLLVVDDESGPRESLKMLLKPEFEVGTTPRGSQALELLRDGPYEIVLLDLTMPDDLSGTETLRAIRENAIDVDVIVITGQGTLETAVECMRLGARDYIAKPYRANAVIGAVRTAFAARAARRRAVQIREHFLGNLSHEFRTPLNAIVGYSEILHDEAGDQLTNEHRRALSRIQLNSERLLSYLEGLFFLAELDSGDLPLRPREFAVRPWLEKLLAPIRREAADSDFSLELECDADLVGHADPETLARLISVLVYEATAAAAGTAIHISARPSVPGAIEFSVQHARPAEAPNPSPISPSAIEECAGGIPSERLASEVIERAARTLEARLESRETDDGAIRVSVHIAGVERRQATPAYRGGGGTEALYAAGHR